MDVLEALRGLVLVVHLLAMAAVVGGALAHLHRRRLSALMVHGSLTALVTGMLLVGLTYAVGDEVDNFKITVKLVIALVIAVLAWVNRGRMAVPETLVTLIGVLTVTNVVVAVMWQ